jgi:hypothetical protein
MPSTVDRRTLLKQLLLLSGASVLPPFLTGCERPKTSGVIVSMNGKIVEEPFATAEQLCLALRTSPDHLPAKAGRLATAQDWAGLYYLVRDQILTYPDNDTYAILSTEAAGQVRWGAAATLRGGAGTLREKADLLAQLYQQAGLEAEVVVWRRELTEAEQRKLLLRDTRQEFRPEIPANLSAKFSKTEQTSPQIDFGGKESKAWADRMLNVLPDNYLDEVEEVPFASGDFNLPAVRLRTPEREYYLDFTDLGQDFASAPATQPEAVSLTAPETSYEHLKLELEAFFTDAPENPEIWIEFDAPLNELAGEQLQLSFLSGLPLAQLATTAVQEVTTFTPVVRVGNQMPKGEPGKAYTRQGDAVSVDAAGHLRVNGKDFGLATGDTPPLSEVTRLEGSIYAGEYPEIELRLRAFNSKNEPVTGLLPGHFKLQEDGKPREALLTSNDFAPKVLLLKDNSGSMPSEYFGPAWEELLGFVTERITTQYPQAIIKVQDTGDNYWEVLNDMAGEGWNALVCISDGELTDQFKTAYETNLRALPPLVFAHIPKEEHPDLGKLADYLEISAVHVENREGLAQSLLAALPAEEVPPYTFRFRAKDRAPGTEVPVELSLGDKLVSLNYQVPERPDGLPRRQLCGLSLLVTYPSGSHRHHLGGYNHQLDQKLELHHLDAAEEALFGDLIIAVEGRRPAEAVWLEDAWRAYLSWHPVHQQLEAEASIDELEKGMAKTRPITTVPFIIMAPLPNPVSKKHLTYEQSCQICLLQRGPRFGKNSFSARANLLNAANHYTVGPSRSKSYRLTAENTLRMAVAEQEMFATSTLALLGQRQLKLLDEVYSIPEKYPGLSPDQQFGYFQLFSFLPGSYQAYPIGVAEDGPLAFLQINRQTGAVLAILPDGTGGGSEEARIAAVMGDLDRAIAALNLMVAGLAAGGAVGAGSAASLGAVAVYGQHLARLYGCAALAIFHMDTSRLEARVRAVIARMICEQIKNLAYGYFAPNFANFENIVTAGGGSIPSPCDAVAPKPDWEQ